MGGVEFELTGAEGLDGITAILQRTKGAVGAKGAQVVRRHAASVERIAKQIVPVDTGATKNSIGTDYSGDGRSGEMTATIGPTTKWAPFLEKGTSRAAPYAFMGPAFDRVQPEFIADCERLAGDINL